MPPATPAYADIPVYAMAILTLLDIAITIPFWHLESNGVALYLGKVGFIAINLMAVIAAVAVWKHWDLHRSKTAIGVVAIYDIGMVFILLSNLAVIAIN